MNRSSQGLAIGAGVLSLLFLGTLPLAAQQPSPSGSSTTSKVPSVSAVSRRVPNYFGQLGLSKEQKDSIYQVVSKHQTRIEELKKELAEANEKMVQECESLLDESQKKVLEAKRIAAANTSKARSTKAAVAKSKEEK